jgi:hypothetical protein
MLYFAMWVGDGSKLVPYLPRIIEHSKALSGSSHRRVLIVDDAVESYLRSTDNGKGISLHEELSSIAALSFMKDRDILSSLSSEIYIPTSEMYQGLLDQRRYASAADILRMACMASPLLNNAANDGQTLVYHDTDVKFQGFPVSEPELGSAALRFSLINVSRKNERLWSYPSKARLYQTVDASDFPGLIGNDIIIGRVGPECRQLALKMLADYHRFYQAINPQRFFELTTQSEYSLTDFAAMPSVQRGGMRIRLNKNQADLLSITQDPLEVNQELTWSKLNQFVVFQQGLVPIERYLSKQFEEKFYIPPLNTRYQVIFVGRGLVLSGSAQGKKNFYSEYVVFPDMVNAVSRVSAVSWQDNSAENVEEIPISDVEENSDFNSEIDYPDLDFDVDEMFLPPGACGGGSRKKRAICTIDDPVFQNPDNYSRNAKDQILYLEKYPLVIQMDAATGIKQGYLVFEKRNILSRVIIKISLDLNKKTPLAERISSLTARSQLTTLPICSTQARVKRSARRFCRLLPEEIDKWTSEELERDYETLQKSLNEKGMLPESVGTNVVEETVVKKPASGSTRLGSTLNTVNQAYLGYQLVKGVLHGDVESIGWTVGGMGLSSLGSRLTERLGTFVESESLALRSIGRLSLPIGRTVAGIPMIVGVLQDSLRFHAGEDVAASLMMNSEMLVLSVTEAGFEMAGVEAGPAGMALTLVLMISLDAGKAGEQVAKLKEVIHLSGGETLREGIRAFVGMAVSSDLQDAKERTEANNRLLEGHIQQWYGHPNDRGRKQLDIVASVMTLKGNKVTVQETYTGQKRYKIGGSRQHPIDLSYCITETSTSTSWLESSDDHVYFDALRGAPVTGLRAPFDQSNLVILNWVDYHCSPASELDLTASVPKLTRGDDAWNPSDCGRWKGVVERTTEHTLLPKPLSALEVAIRLNTTHHHASTCHNAVVMTRPGIDLQEVSGSGVVLVDLGAGDDQYATSIDRPHLFKIGAGRVSIRGSKTKDDVAFLDGVVSGQIDLLGGQNLIDASNLRSSENRLDFASSANQAGDILVGYENPPLLWLKGITKLLGRPNKKDSFRAGQDTALFDGKGGGDEITIGHQATLKTVILHPDDRLIFSDEPAPSHVFLSSTTTEVASIRIEAQWMTGISGIGTHLISRVGARLANITEIQFNSTKNAISLSINGQVLQLFYPIQNRQVTQFGFSTEEGYLLFPIPARDTGPVRAGLLYVTPYATESSASLLQRMKSITHPTLALTQHASTPESELILGSRHHQIFDIVGGSGQKKKIYIAGAGANTYRVRANDQIVLDIQTPPADTTAVDLIDLSQLLGVTSDSIALTAEGSTLTLTITVHASSKQTGSTTRIVLNDYEQSGRTLFLLKEPNGQYYQLPRRVATGELRFGYDANVLHLDNSEGTTSVDAKELKALRYSSIALSHLQFETVQYYRQSDALFIAGQNKQKAPISLLIPNFYTEFLGVLCGSEPCQLGLYLGGGDQTRQLNWENLQAHVARPLPLMDYLRTLHKQHIQLYAINFEHSHIIIPLRLHIVTILDFSSRLTRLGELQVEKSEKNKIILKIIKTSQKGRNKRVVPDDFYVSQHLKTREGDPTTPKPSTPKKIRHQKVVKIEIDKTSLGTTEQAECRLRIGNEEVDLLDLLQRKSNDRRSINEELKTVVRAAQRVTQKPSMLTTPVVASSTAQLPPSKREKRAVFSNKPTLAVQNEDHILEMADQYLERHDRAERKRNRVPKKAIKKADKLSSRDTREKKIMPPSGQVQSTSLVTKRMTPPSRFRLEQSLKKKVVVQHKRSLASEAKQYNQAPSAYSRVNNTASFFQNQPTSREPMHLSWQTRPALPWNQPHDGRVSFVQKPTSMSRLTQQRANTERPVSRGTSSAENTVASTLLFLRMCLPKQRSGPPVLPKQKANYQKALRQKEQIERKYAGGPPVIRIGR